MGAAQHAVTDLLVVDQVLQIALQILVNDLLSLGLTNIALHHVGQVGAAMADNLGLGRQLANQVGIALGAGSEAGGDDAHLVQILLLNSLSTGLNHAQNGAAHVVTILVDQAGNGVTSHQQGLNALLLHELQHVASHGQDLFSRVVAIGGVGAVTQVQDVLVGQQLLDFTGHAEATDTGVNNANCASLIKHFIFLHSRKSFLLHADSNINHAVIQTFL